MNKIDLILELVKDGKITTEQAKLLMEKEKEYIYLPTYPYYHQPYTVTFGSGIASTGDSFTITTATSN